jgi:hypothetical protein
MCRYQQLARNLPNGERTSFSTQDKKIVLRMSKKIPYHNDKKKGRNYLTLTVATFQTLGSTQSYQPNGSQQYETSGYQVHAVYWEYLLSLLDCVKRQTHIANSRH